MNPEFLIVLAGIGLFIAALILRYILRQIFNKAGDAIENKFADMKNKQSDNDRADLSDRYK